LFSDVSLSLPGFPECWLTQVLRNWQTQTTTPLSSLLSSLQKTGTFI
jgi:hypothetical protein